MYINYEKKAAEAVSEIKRKKLFRDYPIISAIADKPPYGINEKNGKEIILWGNNNYLGLSQHPKIIAAKIAAIKQHGAGSGGTRNVLGTTKYLDDLESKIAKWHKKEKALVHISALDANIGVLAALGKYFQNCVFISDESNHASIIDGIRASGASKFVFKHNNVKEIEQKLSEVRGLSDSCPIIIVIESLYSMSGDIAPLKEIIALKKKYNALLYVDEVHAAGVIGKTGAGVAEELGVEADIDIICSTLAKSIGCTGGYVTGSSNMIEFLRHYSRNFIYTTALSPDSAAAAIKAIEIIESDEGRNIREKHKQSVSHLKAALKKYDINYLENGTHIVPIIIGDEARTTKISKDLLDEFNLAVTPIFAPTVAVGSARLRVNPTPNHTREMAEEFASALSILLKKYSDIKTIANDVNECDKLNVKTKGAK